VVFVEGLVSYLRYLCYSIVVFVEGLVSYLRYLCYSIVVFVEGLHYTITQIT
jgi:hypothetical protein